MTRSRGGPVLAGVEGGGDAGEFRVLGDQPGQPRRLVVGQGVHRVEDQRLHAGDAGRLGHRQHVVEDRVEERLGLARAGAGGDQRRQRAVVSVRVRRLVSRANAAAW